MCHTGRGRLWLSLLLVLGGVGLVIAQQGETPPAANPGPPGDPDIPSIEANRKNAVEATEESLARGRTLYAARCVMCHGKDGNGKGSLALQVGYKVPDLSRAGALANRTDGEIYYLITRGHEAMPGEQDFITDRDKWDLVNYLRTLPPKG